MILGKTILRFLPLILCLMLTTSHAQTMKACPYRGLFLNLRTANPDDLPQLMKLIDTVSDMGINLLVTEFADNVEYKSHRFKHPFHGCGFTRDQLKHLAAHARSRNVKLVPYFQTLSHTFWLLSHPRCEEFLEDSSERSWHTAWCPSNSKVKDLLQDLLQETIEIFQPDMIHLGLDEVSWGPYRHCEICRKTPPETLFRDIICTYHRQLQKHGIRLMIWHDELLPPELGGTKKSKTFGWKIVDQIPKDVIINIWCYSEDLKTQQNWFNFFHDKGFDVLGAAFNNTPKGFKNIAATYAHSLGFINTFWFEAGSWTAKELSAQSAQAITSTACFGLNPQLTQSKYPRTPAATFYRKWQRLPELPQDLRPTSIPLPTDISYGNSNGQWPGLRAGSEPPPPKAKPPHLWVDGEGFQAPAISLNGKAKYLSFVHASSIPQDMVRLNGTFNKYAHEQTGQYIIHYQNSQSIPIKLEFRLNIHHWNSNEEPLESPHNPLLLSPSGKRWTWSTLIWKNPHPEWPLKGISLKASQRPGNSVACRDITAWNGLETLTAQAPVKHGRQAIPLPDAVQVFEDFESEQDFRKRWKLNASNLSAPVSLTVKDGFLTMTIPPALSKAIGCLSLQRKLTISTEADARKTFSFPLETNGEVQLGLYVGNDDWSRFRSSQTNYQNRNSVSFSAEALTNYETGQPCSWQDISNLRLNLFQYHAQSITVKLGKIIQSAPGVSHCFNQGRNYHEHP